MARLKNYSVYILKCKDGSLYTGIAKDVKARLKVHNQGKGAKYTRARLPVKLVYQFNQLTKSKALKREYAIKQLKRSDKLKLIRHSS